MPPRRKKRLINLKIKSSHSTTASNNPVNRPYRKFRLPPPPPTIDDMDVSHVNSLNELKFNNNTSLNYNQARRKSFTILPTENIQSSSFSPKNSPQISTQINNKNANDKEPEINNKIIEINKFNKGNKKQDNKSSMLFTFQDFQDVMSETKFANLSKITKQSSVTSFDDDDDDDDYTFFKLTKSSSAPFENYIDGWSVRLEDSSNPNQTNKFIFDDYIDRGRQLTAEKANLLLENIDDEKGLKDSCPRVPKVRFVIQAPSDSLSDEGCEVYSVVNDNDLSLEDGNQDLWMPQSLSPLKITEINDSIEENEATEDTNNSNQLLVTLSEKKITEIEEEKSQDPNVILELEFPIINMEKLNNTIEPPELRKIEKSMENFDNESFKDIPSNIKRDFFFKNMLNNETSACSIIATHSKSKESFDFLNNKKITDINLSSVLNNSESPSSIEEKNNKISSGSIPKIRPKVPPKPLKNQSTTTDDAKCQVLNELVCTFNSIKLKSIDDNNNEQTINFQSKKIIKDDKLSIHNDEINDEIKNLNCACSVDKKTDIKKLIKISSGASNVLDNAIVNNKLSISSNNKNKCAIVSYNYSTKCMYNNDNNNINKIMTDVDVSYDQVSLDILPGRVKNFIKNYEINVTKTTENSKINHTCQDVVNYYNEELKYLDDKNLIKNEILTENKFDGDEKVLEKSGEIVALRLENPIQNADVSLVPDSLLFDVTGSDTGDQSLLGEDVRTVSVKSKAQKIHETTDDHEIEEEIFFDTLTTTTTTIQDANRNCETPEMADENQKCSEENVDTKYVSLFLQKKFTCWIYLGQVYLLNIIFFFSLLWQMEEKNDGFLNT